MSVDDSKISFPSLSSIWLRVLAVALLIPAPTVAGGDSSEQRAPGGGEWSGTVQLPPGVEVTGPTYAEPPALPLEPMVPPYLPTPVIDDGIYIPPQDVDETTEGAPSGRAPDTFVEFRDSTLMPPTGFSSVVNEPNVGSQGDGIFTTHNWYAAISVDNGSTYSYISPYATFPTSPSAFSAGFCCDQRVTQDTSRDLIFWYLQYVKNGSTSGSTNGVRIAVAHGQADLATNTWQQHDFTPADFGLPLGLWLDFPHMQVSANYLYFTSNIFTTTTGSFYGAVVARIPLSQLDSNSALTIDYYVTQNFGSIMAVSGAGAIGTRPGRTTMYFAAVYTSTSLKVLTWPEASGSPTVSNVTGLSTTSFATFQCPGPDMLDPCTRGNGRAQTGWITDTELGVMWASAQQPATRPYPYTRVAILNPTTLAVISQPDIWSSNAAYLYAAVAVNQRGHLGGVIDYLGGSVYPTVKALILDDFSTVPAPWELYTIAASDSGTNGLWGDYNGVVAHERYPNTWIGVGHTQVGGSADANSQPHSFWFGRERDMAGPIFADGFESGDTSAWSFSVP